MNYLSYLLALFIGLIIIIATDLSTLGILIFIVFFAAALKPATRKEPRCPDDWEGKRVDQKVVDEIFKNL